MNIADLFRYQCSLCTELASTAEGASMACAHHTLECWSHAPAFLWPRQPKHAIPSQFVQVHKPALRDNVVLHVRGLVASAVPTKT